jgi:hypothetical protein
MPGHKYSLRSRDFFYIKCWRAMFFFQCTKYLPGPGRVFLLWQNSPIQGMPGSHKTICKNVAEMRKGTVVAYNLHQCSGWPGWKTDPGFLITIQGKLASYWTCVTKSVGDGPTRGSWGSTSCSENSTPYPPTNLKLIMPTIAPRNPVFPIICFRIFVHLTFSFTVFPLCITFSPFFIYFPSPSSIGWCPPPGGSRSTYSRPLQSNWNMFHLPNLFMNPPPHRRTLPLIIHYSRSKRSPCCRRGSSWPLSCELGRWATVSLSSTRNSWNSWSSSPSSSPPPAASSCVGIIKHVVWVDWLNWWYNLTTHFFSAWHYFQYWYKKNFIDFFSKEHLQEWNPRRYSVS